MSGGGACAVRVPQRSLVKERLRCPCPPTLSCVVTLACPGPFLSQHPIIGGNERQVPFDHKQAFMILLNVGMKMPQLGAVTGLESIDVSTGSTDKDR